MSASIVSERSHLEKRGQLLAWIFSNQGWVSFGISVFGHRICTQKMHEHAKVEPQLTQFSFSRVHSQVRLLRLSFLRALARP
jgi:hypothetical protein